MAYRENVFYTGKLEVSPVKPTVTPREDRKYPDIKVKLVGKSNNAYSIAGEVEKELKAQGVENSEIDAFYQEAFSGDYSHLWSTCLKWVSVY